MIDRTALQSKKQISDELLLDAIKAVDEGFPAARVARQIGMDNGQFTNIRRGWLLAHQHLNSKKGKPK